MSGMVGPLSETFSNLNAIYCMRTASLGYDYSAFKLHDGIAGLARDEVNIHSTSTIKLQPQVAQTLSLHLRQYMD